MPGGVDFQPLVLAHFGTGPAVQHDAWTICGWRRRPSRPTCVVDSQCMSGGKRPWSLGFQQCARTAWRRPRRLSASDWSTCPGADWWTPPGGGRGLQRGFMSPVDRCRSWPCLGCWVASTRRAGSPWSRAAAQRVDRAAGIQTTRSGRRDGACTRATYRGRERGTPEVLHVRSDQSHIARRLPDGRVHKAPRGCAVDALRPARRRRGQVAWACAYSAYCVRGGPGPPLAVRAIHGGNRRRVCRTQPRSDSRVCRQDAHPK